VQSQLEGHKSQLNACVAELAEQRLTIQDLQSRCDRLQQDSDSSEREREAAESSLETLRDKLVAAEDRLSESRRELSAAEATIGEKERRIAELADENELLEKQGTAESNDLKQKVEALNWEIAKKNEHLENERRISDDLRREHCELEQAVSAKMEELSMSRWVSWLFFFTRGFGGDLSYGKQCLTHEIQAYLHHDGGVVRSRRYLGGVGVGFFCPTPDVQLDYFLHHTPKLGIPLEMVQFLLKLLLKQISCCAPRFPLILTAKLHSVYVTKSEILESRSRIFYLRLRNPDLHEYFKCFLILLYPNINLWVEPNSSQGCLFKARI